VIRQGFQQKLFEGFCVVLDNKIIGLLLYSELNIKTITVHFEFMDPAFDGVAQLMNNH
jgi:hypothetical protein